MKTTCERIELTKQEMNSGLAAMWDVIGRKGHYVISFGERGFTGYQLETNDAAGESSLEPWQVQQIVNYFGLTAGRR